MSSGLEWRLPRAQSARPCGPAASPSLPPPPEFKPAASSPIPPRCPSAPPSSAVRPSPPSPAQRCTSAAPPRLPTTTAAAAPPKKYWELGGLGPVMNEDWEMRRERRMRQKAFGRAANAANCRARASALAAAAPLQKEDSGGEQKVTHVELDHGATGDPEEEELATRAALRDVAAALALG